MKRLILSLALLGALPALAVISYDEAQRNVATAQARVNEIKNRMAALETQANTSLKNLQSVGGQEKYAHAIKSGSEEIIQHVSQRESLRAELKAALEERGKVYATVGKRFPVSFNQNGEAAVGQRERAIPASQSSQYIPSHMQGHGN